MTVRIAPHTEPSEMSRRSEAEGDRAGLSSETAPAPARKPSDTVRSETIRRGTEIYERDIKPTLDESHHGRYVSIDVDTGCWTIADTRRVSIDELHERYPDVRNAFMLRVGYRALIRLGGSPLRSSE